MTDLTAAARLCAAWLLWYPDEQLAERLPQIRAAVAELPEATRAPLSDAVAWLDEVGFVEAQRHYVDTFDMRRRTALYLSFWTDGDTRNRGFALLRFKHLFPPVDDVTARRAVLAAVDQDTYMQAVDGGSGAYRDCKAFIPCGMPLSTGAGSEAMRDSLEVGHALLTASRYDGR